MLLTSILACYFVATLANPLVADEVSDALAAQVKHDWKACLPLAQAAVKVRPWNERAWDALIQSQLHTGDGQGAADTFAEAFRRFPSSLRLRLAGRDALRMTGGAAAGEALIAEVDALVKQAPWRYTDAENRVLLGGYYLEVGADARQVLEVFYDQAKRSAPDAPEPHIAAGQLALQKGDFALAATSFQEALKRDAERPDAMLGLARAFLDSDQAKATEYLEQLLSKFPGFVPGLLLLAERQIDGELFDEATKTLDQALDVNPDEPRAWALLSVISTLLGDEQRAAFHRRVALGWWPENPEVDHLIGQKLSRHYRFAEGAELQRNVLKLRPNHADAKLQLAQDLLRLGQEEEGWRLANESLDADGYSVLAHNLVQLREQLGKFTTLEDEHFIVRMDAQEAAVYGKQVMELLTAARSALCEKYSHELRTPVIVEIFPRQADFAIRTFGLPGGEGFLGVCFGNVITANSPSSQGDTPANWASVLWHEFCHVVTLQKTSNRMPRWLSEGISVYEERQRRAGWGQTMTPQYRRMILGGELTPVSQLSDAFLRPESGLHLQFAYYESSLVVEYLAERHGLDALKRTLDELGQGMPINDSLARTAGSIEALDREFAAYAKQRAEALAPEADWAELPEDADAAARRAWLSEHPQSLAALQQRAAELLRAKQWDEAEPKLRQLVEWLPDETAAGSPRAMLAELHRARGDADRERQAWRDLLEVDDQNYRACQRLMELAAAAEDWPEAVWAGQRLAEINPLQVNLQRQLGLAAASSGDSALAARAWSALIALGPADPADAHYRLALALESQGDVVAAKRHALMALEEAPRYRDAQRLLLSLVAAQQPPEPSKLLPPLESLAPEP
ncbi:MAG: tetratricopeptide repeat protein [Planctomycetales bacterium]|nr:tetratricopeptide repeat protein [Planctomycetales bacterium]